jgi:hypothetical protein
MVRDVTREMYDATNRLVKNIPLDAQVVGGYIDGAFAWSAADWARFPRATKVRIAVFESTDDGHAGDSEPGNMTPAGLVRWVVRRRAAGVDPTGYCSTGSFVVNGTEYGWAACKAAFAAARVPEPHWWVAAYPGGGQVIPAGAIAHQFEDAGIYDRTIASDYWPGVDGGDMLTDVQIVQLFEQIGDIQERMASMHAGQWLPWKNPGQPDGPGGDLSWFQQQSKTALAPIAVQLAAIQGGLAQEDAVVVAALAGVDADVKAGIAQLAKAIVVPAPGAPVDVTKLATQLAGPLIAALAPLIPPELTPAQFLHQLAAAVPA